jgi:hypothetical protein
MPAEIAKFSDIKLRDYNKKTGCQGNAPVLKNKYTLNAKDELFIKYAENTKKMIQSAADNQSKLLTVINDLFTYVIDPYSGKKVIRINPKLNDELLQQSVEKSRRFIVDLYIKCESDYVNGVKLYEAIVESKILETTQKQIETLKTEASKIIKETQKTSAPAPVPVSAPITTQPPVIINVPSIQSSLSSDSTSSTSTSSIPSTSISNNTGITQLPSNSQPTSLNTQIPDKRYPNMGYVNRY